MESPYYRLNTHKYSWGLSAWPFHAAFVFMIFVPRSSRYRDRFSAEYVRPGFGDLCSNIWIFSPGLCWSRWRMWLWNMSMSSATCDHIPRNYGFVGPLILDYKLNKFMLTNRKYLISEQSRLWPSWKISAKQIMGLGLGWKVKPVFPLIVFILALKFGHEKR